MPKGEYMRLNVILYVLCIISCVVSCSGGGGKKQHTSSLPAVFWVSQPVMPDESMLISGGNFSENLSVEIAQLPDGDAGSPLDEASSDLEWQSIPLLTKTSRSVTATVPAEWSSGIYALRLINGSDAGQARLVNAPDPWFVQGDQGDTATPGGYFTVAGNCLEITGGSGPKAALVRDGAVVSTLPLLDRITTSTGYSLRYSVPSDIAEGTYELYLHNGCGAEAGWVKFSTFIEAALDTVTIKNTKPWPSKIINLAAQQGANDDDRFERAIAEASANGGGRIQIAAGTHILTTQLVLPNYTVLEGEDRESTVIKWNAAPVFSDASVTSLIIGETLPGGQVDRATFAMEDLTIDASFDSFAGYVVDRSFTDEPGWLRRVGIKTLSTAEKSWSKTPIALFLRQTSNTQLENLLIDSAQALYARDGVTYLRLSDSTIRWNNLNIWISSNSHNFLITGNSFEKRGPIEAQASLCFTAFYGTRPYTRDLLWAGNTCTQVATDTSPLKSGYTMDGGAGVYLGRVDHADGTTLYLAGPTDTVNQADKPITYDWTGGIVQILDGKGAGQWRYLTKATEGSTTIEVERPWDIDPDSTSTAAVNNMLGRILMIDNDYEREIQHDDYYMTVDSIKAGNRFGVFGANAAASGWMGRHYKGMFPAWHMQFLGNRIVRGTLTSFSSLVINEPASDYTGVIGANHVYRNNVNESDGLAKIYIRTMDGPFSSAVIEGNTVDSINFQGQPTDPVSVSGILIRKNTLPDGGSSPVLPEGDIEGVINCK